MDLSGRCHAEHAAIHTSEKGDFEKIAPRITRCVTAIKWCYAGDHTRCKAHSSVCKGDQNNNWIVKSAYLKGNFKIDITKKENEETLADCIGYRLGDDILQKTKLNLNSQKVEATNRAIRMCLPKNVTFPRNFSGRAHSAIHSVNNGTGDSICKLCAAAGCPITQGGGAERSLRAAQLRAEKKKKREQSLASKLKRKMKKDKLFKMHEKNKEKSTYIKGQLLKVQKSRCVKAQKPTLKSRLAAEASAKDHLYARTRSRSRKRQAEKCSLLQNPEDEQ